MFKKSSWRKALVAPVVLSLAVSGALLTSTAASAAPADLTVTSPVAASTVESRTVVFTGTGTTGSTVNVLEADGGRVPGTTAAVVSNGTWSTTGTFADDAAIAQIVNVRQTTGGGGDGAVSVSFNLPAAAPEFNFSVTGPTEGQTVGSRTVVFTGTGTDGSTVNVLGTDNNRVPGTTAAVVSNGVWSTTGTYADDAAVAQTVNVNQVTGGAGRGNATVNFVLPAVAPEFNFSVTSPTEGQTVESRTVVFTGTGTDGSTVNVLDVDGNRVPGTTAAVVSNGVWSTTGTYADDAAVAQTVNVNQVTGGAGRGNATVNFLLPADLIAAPVITSPTNGETVTGDRVTFTGTGVPGENILLAVVPTDLLDELVDPSGRQAPAVEELDDPTDPVIVDENGEWTVTVALDPEDYTAVATHVEIDADGLLTALLSLPSEPVEFTLVAATAPAGVPGNGGQLAATGAATNGFIGVAALLTLGGAALLVLRRKRELLG